MEELNEHLERLEKACEEMKLITELTEKYKDNKIVADMLLNKDIEDGMLGKLDTATVKQLKWLKTDYSFKYYTKSVTDALIDQAILKNIRREKLKRISDGQD